MCWACPAATDRAARPGGTMTTDEPTISTPWRSDPAAMTERIEKWWTEHMAAGVYGRRRDRARGQRHVERDAAVHRRTGRRPRGALRRPAGAACVAAVPGVPRVRPRAATEGHADRRRAHRRAGAGGAHPRDRPRVARFAVPPHAPRRRHRAVRHPAVHDGRLVVRRRARRPAQARARGGARAGTAARAHAGDATTSRSSTARSSPAARSTSTSSTSAGTTTGRARASGCR